MRPIVRGKQPLNVGGQPVPFDLYPNARATLIARLGQYCSYCESPAPTSLAVEHIRPKRPPGATQDDLQRKGCWDNFLLACANCNSTKGNHEVMMGEYVWPDRDNTFRAFEYSVGGIVRAHSQLDDATREKARRMIVLVGLDRTPNDDKASDRRWMNRGAAWDIAQRSKVDLQRCNTKEMKRAVVTIATGNGFWSVWMTVFQDDPDMCRRFIQAFPGTCGDCFAKDDTLRPVQTLGGIC